MGNSPNLLRTILAGGVAAVVAMVAGCAMGWMSPTEVLLTSDDSFMHLDGSEVSWVGSLLALGSVVGPLVAGKVADRIGRRWTLLALAVPFVVGWVLKGLAQPCKSVALLYVARIIQGVANGAVFTVLPMYQGEIAEDSIRGALGSFLQLLITVGFVYEYAIGPYVPYWVVVVLSAIVPVLWVIAMFFMPESPYYLVAQDRPQDAERALQWLRGTRDVKEELNDIQTAITELQQNQATLKDLVATKGNRKALLLSMGLVAGQQLCGINAILFYGTGIFKKTHSTIPSAVQTILIGVVMFGASFVTPFVVDRLGRRPLFFISSVGMTIGLAALGAFFYMDNDDPSSVKDLSFLPILSLMLFIVVYSMGFGALPWAVMGELFPANIKANASSVTASFCWLLAFFITKFFEDLSTSLGMAYTFWIFGIFSILAGIFVFFLLPETKGRSLQEIQDILNK